MFRVSSTSRWNRAALAAPFALLPVLAGCQNGQGLNYNPPVASPGIGTAGGAGAGALLGRMIAGGHDNTIAMLGGALLGGVAGNVLVDNPRARNQEAQNEAARDADMQRRLDYEKQSQLQQAQTQQQIQEQQLFDQWKAQRTAGAAPATGAMVSGPADVSTAQRLLTGLGYYRGPVDGVNGAGTRSAVEQFEQAQGLPRTGVVTPSILQRMRQALAA